MKLPLVLEDCGTVRDADGRVVISKINPCTIPERREIVHAVNMRKDMERKIAGQRAAIRALESNDKSRFENLFWAASAENKDEETRDMAKDILDKLFYIQHVHVKTEAK